MEKYSVLMSLYSKETAINLEQAINSIVHQTYMPDEIVIVKDGYITVELQTVIDKYEKKYPGLFNVVGYNENKGLGYALNYGIKYCKNELVARMDTDDISLPNRCEQQIMFFEQDSGVDIVGGNIDEFIGDVSNIVGTRTVPCLDSEIKEYMKKRCPLNHVTVMYKKSAVEKAGGYQDWFWNEDYYLWIRMYLNGAVFRNTGTKLVNVRVGKEMYQRRGGKKYFKSEYGLQKYMYKNQIIPYHIYLLNVAKRFIVQILLPNQLRAWVFKTFAREKNNE